MLTGRGIFLSKIREVLKLALPAVAEMFLYMLIWVTDTAFMGHYGGSIAVSAVGFGSEIVYTLVNIFIFLGVSAGISTMVAQSIGAKEKEKAEEFLAQGLLVGVLLAIIILLILSFFAHFLLQLAGLKGQVLAYATIYIKIAAFGAFCNMLSSMLNAGLRGMGNTVTPLAAAILMNIVHVFLAWLLIFGQWGLPALGVKGIALATAISQFLGLAFLAFYYYRYSDLHLQWRYFCQVNKNRLREIIKIAVPSGLQEGVFNSSRLLTLTFIMHLGNTAFAANEITTTIESISFMPGWGFALAAITLVGQSVGAKLYKEAKEYAYLSAAFGVGIMSVCALVFLTASHYLVSFFIREPETAALASLCLMVAALEQPFMGLAMVLEGALKGSGDAKSPFYVALISNWVIRIPGMYYVIFILQLNVMYVWLVMAVQWIFEGITIFLLFQRRAKGWKEDNKGREK